MRFKRLAFLEWSLLSLTLVACGIDHTCSPIAPRSSSGTEWEVGAVQSQSIANLTWQVPAQLPNAVRAATAAWDGSRLYVFGGDSGAANLITLNQIYNPATNTWTKGPSSALPRDFAAAASLSDGVHPVGGAGANGVLANHRVYPRSSNTWVVKAPLRGQASPQ